MALDYVLLWMLVLANTFAILLIIRQFAAIPKFTRRPGPQPGLEVGDWVMKSFPGPVVRSSEVPNAYTLLFVSAGCQPCLALLAELRRGPRPRGALYLITQDDGSAFAEADRDGAPYDALLIGDRGALYERLGIPGTPYAVRVSDGKVVVARAVSTVEKLAEVMSTLPGAGAPQPTLA